MFNIADEIVHFKPIDLSNLEQKLGSIPEDMKGAIELYNKALEDIANRNEDMAVIALKKAIAIYPAFYEAMNLMGVCYESLGDEENARFMFQKIIQMEDSSIRAQEYLNRLDGISTKEDGNSKGKAKAQKPRREKKQQPNPVNWVGGPGQQEKAGVKDIKHVILGAVLGVVAMVVLWLALPSDKPLFKYSPIINDPQQIQELESKITLTEQHLNDALAALEKANQKEMGLRDEMDKYKKWVKTLRELEAMAKEEKYKEVVVEVEKNLTGLDIPEDIEAEIIALSEACKPKAVQQAYAAGKKLYDGNSKSKSMDVFNQAAAEYTIAIQILDRLDEKPNNAAEIYYYGGKALAQSEYPSKDEALKEARRCFTVVIEISPNSKLAGYAQGKINEIDSGKAVKY
jgi:tetratricopeptide (TPR) repeat protein